MMIAALIVFYSIIGFATGGMMEALDEHDVKTGRKEKSDGTSFIVTAGALWPLMWALAVMVMPYSIGKRLTEWKLSKQLEPPKAQLIKRD